MSYRIVVRAATETPIERIFEKVTHRKMNAEERKALQLESGSDLSVGKSSDSVVLNHKNGAKLTTP